MSNLKLCNNQLQRDEEIIWESNSVSICDSEERMITSSNRLQLTSHRLILYDQLSIKDLQLPMVTNSEIKKTERKTTIPGTSRINRQIVSRVLIHLTDKTFMQFEFELGGHNEFLDQLNQQLIRKHWLYSNNSNRANISTGISGIEKQIQNRIDSQDQKISESFKDLKVLMNQAKEMVTLSNVLISKLSKDKSKLTEANIEEDEEMKKLRSCFLNMGIIDNPVTKESSGSKYHKDLALEIYNTLFKRIDEQGGIMTLVEAFCLLNRARAIAGLISPEDHLNACKQLNKLNVNLKYNIYPDLNLHVLEIPQSSKSIRINEEICELVTRDESLSAFNLSKIINCNLIVAKKYLLDLETIGKLCRDDTTMGLRFYINKF